MRPLVLIIEPRREVADALQDVLLSARFNVRVVSHLERLTDLVDPPAAIVVRIAFEGTEPAHAAIAQPQAGSRYAFQEAAIVADDEKRARLGFQQSFEPENAFDVQMIRGLIHQEDIRFQHERLGNGEPFLPPTG